MQAEQNSRVSVQQFNTRQFSDPAHAHHASKGNLWGLSLNERLLGKRCVSSSIQNDGRELPSFELWDTENTNLDATFKQVANPNQFFSSSEQVANANNCFSSSEQVANTNHCFSFADDDINGPLVNQALDQLVIQMAQNEKLQQTTPVSLEGKSMPSSSFVTAEKILSKHSIFQNQFEHEFYMTLTKSTTEYR